MHFMLLAACNPAATDSNVDLDSAEDSPADTGEPVDTAGLDLNGTAPAEDLPVPEFNATNRDGSSRSGVDLVGYPTIVWFYPAAATGG